HRSPLQRFPRTHRLSTHTGARRWSPLENRCVAACRRTRTGPCPGASRRASGAGTAAPAPRAAMRPESGFRAVVGEPGPALRHSSGWRTGRRAGDCRLFAKSMYPSVQSTLALASLECTVPGRRASISSALLPRRRPYERYRTDRTPKLAQHDSPKGTAVIAKKNVARRAALIAPTGVPGFDELSHGGLPRKRTTLVMGGPGTGKTVFALQTLVG